VRRSSPEAQSPRKGLLAPGNPRRKPPAKSLTLTRASASRQIASTSEEVKRYFATRALTLLPLPLPLQLKGLLPTSGLGPPLKRSHALRGKAGGSSWNRRGECRKLALRPAAICQDLFPAVARNYGATRSRRRRPSGREIICLRPGLSFIYVLLVARPRKRIYNYRGQLGFLRNRLATLWPEGPRLPTIFHSRHRAAPLHENPGLALSMQLSKCLHSSRYIHDPLFTHVE
jgi:hypothetical protein